MHSPTENTTRPDRRLVFQQVRHLYLLELKGALRERTILFNSIIVPIFLYPFLLWLAFSGLMFVTGQSEKQVSRIAVREWPSAAAELRASLGRDEQINLLRPTEVPSSPEQALKDGKIDAWLQLLPAEGPGAAVSSNFQVKIVFDQSKDRSVSAKRRIEEATDRFRSKFLERESQARNIPRADWQVFALELHNVASGKQMGAFILGLLLPIIFVVMVAVGCFYPAVDAVAGERERGTWETLMSCAATRLSVVTGKYLYVATMGGLAGALNVASVLLTVKPVFAPLLRESGRSIELALPLSALPVLAISAVLLAGFVAAGMMLFATFARTFKEGQSMITPFYMMIMLPVVFLQVPGLKLTPLLAMIPVVNITLMVREAISGDLHWLPALAAVASSLIYIMVLLRLAAFVLKFEDVVSGTFQGTLFKLLRLRLVPRKRPLESH